MVWPTKLFKFHKVKRDKLWEEKQNNNINDNQMKMSENVILKFLLNSPHKQTNKL